MSLVGLESVDDLNDSMNNILERTHCGNERLIALLDSAFSSPFLHTLIIRDWIPRRVVGDICEVSKMPLAYDKNLLGGVRCNSQTDTLVVSPVLSTK